MGTWETEPSELAAYVEALPILVWASGQDHGGTYFNRAWREFTGRTQDELAGDGWIADVHPDDVPVLEACAEAFNERRAFQIQFRLRRHDGAWRWMLDTATPYHTKEGLFRGFLGACADITERKATEETLLSSEALSVVRVFRRERVRL